MARNPDPGTAAELVKNKGLKALNGEPLLDVSHFLQIDRKLIEKLIEDSEPDDVHQAWRERLYSDANPTGYVHNVTLNTALLVPEVFDVTQLGIWPEDQVFVTKIGRQDVLFTNIGSSWIGLPVGDDILQACRSIEISSRSQTFPDQFSAIISKMISCRLNAKEKYDGCAANALECVFARLSSGNMGVQTKKLVSLDEIDLKNIYGYTDEITTAKDLVKAFGLDELNRRAFLNGPNIVYATGDLKKIQADIKRGGEMPPYLACSTHPLRAENISFVAFDELALLPSRVRALAPDDPGMLYHDGDAYIFARKIGNLNYLFFASERVNDRLTYIAACVDERIVEDVRHDRISLYDALDCGKLILWEPSAENGFTKVSNVLFDEINPAYLPRKGVYLNTHPGSGAPEPF